MAGKAGLKAGLIGAAVLVVLTLLGLIPVPYLGCVCCGVQLLAYVGIGVLAGSFLAPPRSAGAGAGAGAIAGLVSGVGAGVVEVIVVAIRALTGGVNAGALTPEQMRQLAQIGMDPQTLRFLTGTGGTALTGAMCCLGSLAIGAVLGAIGGVIFGAAKRD